MSSSLLAQIHYISALAFLVIYLIKTVLLFTSVSSLDRFAAKVKVPEMIISTLFLVTGIWLLVILGGIKVIYIIKLAMVQLHQELEAAQLPARLLLQVHDELVLDEAAWAVHPVPFLDEIERVKELGYRLKLRDPANGSLAVPGLIEGPDREFVEQSTGDEWGCRCHHLRAVGERR